MVTRLSTALLERAWIETRLIDVPVQIHEPHESLLPFWGYATPFLAHILTATPIRSVRV
jgi:hypothetical protein